MTTNTSVTTNGLIDQNITTWLQTNRYNAGDTVLYNGAIYQANSVIPANTAFTIGTTGATWALVVLNGAAGGAIVQMTCGGGTGTLWVRTATGKVFTTEGSGGDRTPGNGRANTIGYSSMPGITGLSELFLYDATLDYEEPGTATWIGFQGGTGYILCSTGNLWGWGFNGNGQLGIGSTGNQFLPRRLRTGVAEVYVHPSGNAYLEQDLTRAIIRGTDNKIYACGYNGRGQLGLGNTTNPISSWVELPWALGNTGLPPRNVWNFGSSLGCILVETNEGGNLSRYKIAGFNGNGQFGTGGTLQYNTAIDITSLWAGDNTAPTQWRIRDAIGGFGYWDGNYNSSCWMGLWVQNSSNTTNSQLKMAGVNTWGTIGNGSTGGNQLTPFTVPLAGSSIYDLKQISGLGGGAGAVYALRTDGVLFSWGYNGFGQIGVGNTTNQANPQSTSLMTGVKEILYPNVVAWYNEYWSTAYFRKTDGTYWAAGQNTYGQAGVARGDTTTITTWQRMFIPRTRDWTVLGAMLTQGALWTPVMYDSDGVLWAWGYNGDGNTGIAGIESGSIHWYMPTQVNPPNL